MRGDERRQRVEHTTYVSVDKMTNKYPILDLCCGEWLRKTENGVYTCVCSCERERHDRCFEGRLKPKYLSVLEKSISSEQR